MASRRRRSSKTQDRASDDTAQALQVLVRLLRYKPRTEAQARQALLARGFLPETVDQALQKAREQGWLNDAAFARLWVEERARLRPRARWVLARELREKGIEEALIRQVLEEIDEWVLAHTALQQAWKRYRNLPREAARRKLAAYLARRGFAYDLIYDLLAAWETAHGLPTSPEIEERAP